MARTLALSFAFGVICPGAPSKPLFMYPQPHFHTSKHVSPKALEEVEFKGSGLHITKSPDQQPALLTITVL